MIIPWLDFENNETNTKPPSEYTGEDYHSLKRGVKNGLQNGLKMIVDIEGWDYAYFSRGAKGLRMVLGDPRDKMVVNQVRYNLDKIKLMYLTLFWGHPLSTYARRGRGGGDPKAYVVSEVA